MSLYYVLVKFTTHAAAKYGCEDFIVMRRTHYDRIIAYVTQKLKAGEVHFLFGNVEFYLEDDIRYLTNDLDIIPLKDSEVDILKLTSVGAKFGTPLVNNTLIQ